jgi:2Fe-2S ferredoxin
MPRITFLPLGVTVDCADGESLFEVARRMGVPVATACAGKATCGLCRMKILGGEQHLTPFNAGERKHLGNVYFITKERLSCQARVQGSGDEVHVEVKVPLEKLNR